MYDHPFNQVREFHAKFGINNPEAPGLPDGDTRALRMRLLEEEYNEYLAGEANNDIVEIADALGDIIYVALGTALSYGIPLDAIFNEIHRSNLSKLDENGNVLRRADGKIMKSALYSKPDVEGVMADPYKDAEALRACQEANERYHAELNVYW